MLQSEINGRDLFKRILAQKAVPPWFNGRTGRRETSEKQKRNSFQIMADYLEDVRRRGKKLSRW